MHLMVNARHLLPNRLDGIGWFSYQTLKRLVQANPEVKFTFLFDRPFSEEMVFGSNVIPKVIFPPARHPLLYIAHFNFSTRAELQKGKPNLYLSTDGFLVEQNHTPQLGVMHDINFLHYPSDLKFAYRWYYNHYFPRFAKIATRLATVSEFSKRDIATNYDIDEQKIDVVYNGVNEGYRVLDEKDILETRNKISGGKPYFLFVGSLSPRKNLIRLIEAYHQYGKQTENPYDLVIAGGVFWGDEGVKRAIQCGVMGNNIHLTGRLPQEELEKVMASAFALTFVPYYEGFGIPMIEAMQCGVPVIAANTSCLPEIAGEAALYTDPFNSQTIAKAMLSLHKDDLYRESLIKLGFEQVKKYSWDNTAKLLWKSVLKTLNQV